MRSQQCSNAWQLRRPTRRSMMYVLIDAIEQLEHDLSLRRPDKAIHKGTENLAKTHNGLKLYTLNA